MEFFYNLRARSTLRGKICISGGKFFSSRVDPVEKGEKNEICRVASLKGVSFHFR